MDNAKIFFQSNLKFLRNRKKLGQDDLSKLLNISRSKLSALENGQTKAPQPEDLITFSNFYKISIDSLMKVDLSRLGELKLRELEAGNDVYMTGTKLRVVAISVDAKGNQNMEYVPVKAKAGYAAGYNDSEYIAALPKFSMPNLPEGTFRMFPTKGDSMLPIPEGSDVIAQYIEDWTTIKPDTPCIVILKGSQDFVFKLVSIHQREYILKSLNSVYKPYSVEPENVLEIWKFLKYQTGEFPDAPTDMDKLKMMIQQLQVDVQNIKYV
jgi:transcriptional regulator with XRE-family HTH domain